MLYKKFKLELLYNKGRSAITNPHMICAVADCTNQIKKQKTYVRIESQSGSMAAPATYYHCEACGYRGLNSLYFY